MDTCSICGSPASRACGACRVATYCSEKCQAKDWNALHQCICINVDDPDHAKVRQLLDLVEPGQSHPSRDMNEIAEMVQLGYPIDGINGISEWKDKYQDWRQNKKRSRKQKKIDRARRKLDRQEENL
jgi:hypothetical protein